MGSIFKTNGGSSSSTNPITFRNHLVNAGFDIWQVGTSVTATNVGGASHTLNSTSQVYGPDQWYVSNTLGGSGVAGVITLSQVTGVTAGSLFGASVKITTAPTVTGIQNGCELYQVLSNRASLCFYGQTASFSVLVKALGNVTQVGIQFYYKTTEAKVDTSIGSEILTTVNSSTFSSCIINGQALGTSQTTAGVVGVRIRPTAVSSGNLYDLNNGFVVEQASMNIGASALTSFSRQFDDPSQELASCQLFYEKSYDLTVAPGTNLGADGAGSAQIRLSATLTSSAIAVRLTVPFKVSKRATPTITGYSTDGTISTARDRVNGANVTANKQSIGLNGFTFDLTASANNTSYFFEASWTADARM